MTKTLLSYLFCGVLILSSCKEKTDSRETAAKPTLDSPDTAAAANTLFTPDPSFIVADEVVSIYGPSSIVRDVIIDNTGKIWMAAWDGIISYDRATKQFTNHTLQKRLAHYRTYSVMQDSKGNLWFGTLGAGVYKYDGTRFVNYNSNNGLVHNHVVDLFEDSKGNIWMGTMNGVSRYDGNDFMNIDSTKNLPGEIYSVSEDGDGNIWLGGERGLYIWQSAADTVTEVLSEKNTPYTNVRDLCYTNAMYIGVSSGFYMCPDEDRPFSKLIALNGKFTSYIRPDHTGKLLLTTSGLNRFETGTHDASYKRYENILPETRNNLALFGASEAEDGTIWYGAMDGLHSVKDGEDKTYGR
jgi:ligand-binding sensor domain-containing protein